MPLRARVLSHLGAIYLVLFALAFMVVRGGSTPLLLVEVLLAAALLVGFLLIRSLVKPAELLGAGAERIRHRDFTTRFRTLGLPETDHLIGIYNEMVDQLREERRKAQERHFFLDKILAASPAGIITLDHDGRVDYLNASAMKLLNRADGAVEDKRLDELGSPLAAGLAQLPPGGSRVFVLAGRRRVKCSHAEFFDHGFARSFFVIEELTEELRELERAAYEKLIRLMSHEVSNSVGAVISLLDSCRDYGSRLAAEEREDIDYALTAASSRMEHLNAFMKGFAEVVRLPEPALRPCDLDRLIKDIRILLEPELKRQKIELTFELLGPMPPILLDKNQIEQVLINLFKNSMEAIGANGRIKVRLDPGAGSPCLSIRDTGTGIPQEVQRQLFTPFFTTKRGGRGLGLTLVSEILAQHNFDFSFENCPDGGTEFIIYLRHERIGENKET